MVTKVHLKEEYFGVLEIENWFAFECSSVVEAPDRKAHGKYYTPEDVTCLMVTWPEQWMSNKAQRIHTETRLRFLDPTVGAGAFYGNGALSRD